MTTGERDPELLRQLGALVRETRELIGLDQAGLAAAAAVARVQVQQLERGSRYDGKPWAPKPATVLAIVDALNEALASAGKRDDRIPRLEALRLAGIPNPDRYVSTRVGRPAGSVQQLSQLAAQLTSRQLQAVLEIVEAILYPAPDDGTDEELPDEVVHHTRHSEPRRLPRPEPGQVEHVTHVERSRD